MVDAERGVVAPGEAGAGQPVRIPCHVLRRLLGSPDAAAKPFRALLIDAVLKCKSDGTLPIPDVVEEWPRPLNGDLQQLLQFVRDSFESGAYQIEAARRVIPALGQLGLEHVTECLVAAARWTTL
jgi:hypothetical protein